jgi:glyoxylase-like metal-dependent hydrolase (beta-lactamase superfamily II)
MKKLLRAAGIILGILVVTVVCFGLWIKSQTKDLKPVESARINDTTFIVKGVIGNMYLVGNGRSFVAIDAADNAAKVLSGLATLSISPDSIKAVFLTHSDADHTAALPLFRNASVYLSKAEVAVLTGAAPRHFLFLTHKNTLPVSRYTTLSDMDSVVVDGRKVIARATPGHTVGSMSYEIAPMLFTGDLCIIKNGAIEPMLWIFTEDRLTDSLSIRRCAQIPGIGFIGTAHSGYTADLKTAFAQWR